MTEKYSKNETLILQIGTYSDFTLDKLRKMKLKALFILYLYPNERNNYTRATWRVFKYQADQCSVSLHICSAPASLLRLTIITVQHHEQFINIAINEYFILCTDEWLLIKIQILQCKRLKKMTNAKCKLQTRSLSHHLRTWLSTRANKIEGSDESVNLLKLDVKNSIIQRNITQISYYYVYQECGLAVH